jgi:hypothetical protein
MISHDALSGRIGLDQHIEVRDDAGEWFTGCPSAMP